MLKRLDPCGSRLAAGRVAGDFEFINFVERLAREAKLRNAIKL